MLFFFSLLVYPILLGVLAVALLLVVQVAAYGLRVRARRQGRPEPKISLWLWSLVAVSLSVPLFWVILVGGMERMLQQSKMKRFCLGQRTGLQDRLPDPGKEGRTTRRLSVRSLQDPSLTYLDLSCPSTWAWSKEGLEDGKPRLPRPPQPDGWTEDSADFFIVSEATAKKHNVGPIGYDLQIYCRQHFGRTELVREVFPESSFLGAP